MLNTDFRPKSASRIREKNPILPFEQPVTLERPARAKVDQSFYYSKYPSERPKGKSRNDNSKKAAGTLSVYQDEQVEHRPCIRVNIPQMASNLYERPQSIKVVGYDSTKNPVIEERAISRKRNDKSPSPMLKYENERKCFLPSDLGMRTSGWGDNRSSVFSSDSGCYLFGGKVKKVVSKECEVKNLIGYEYALPYRDQKVTPKPNYV